VLKSFGQDESECVDTSKEYQYNEKLPESSLVLDNHALRLTLNESDGSLISIFNKKEDIQMDI